MCIRDRYMSTGLITSQLASTIFTGIGLPAIEIKEDYVVDQTGKNIPIYADGRISLLPQDKIGYMRFHTPYEAVDLSLIHIWIVCVFMYFVKNLEHINRWINWTKAKYPKIEFVQVPHWNLTYILRGGMYCVPNPKVKLLKLADVVKAMQLTHGAVSYTHLKGEISINDVV